VWCGALIKAGSKRIEEGRELLLGLGHRRKKRLEEGDDRWVPPVSRRKEKRWVPVRERRYGPRADSVTGPNRFPGSISIFISSFLLFFFCFLISFVSFAKMHQINSNHFQKFSKNQSNDLTLQKN
jgi:hypothetical protein